MSAAAPGLEPQSPIQGRFTDSQLFCRLSFSFYGPAGFLQAADNQLLLIVGALLFEINGRIGIRMELSDFIGQIFHLNGLRGFHIDGVLQRIFQFTDISGPGIGGQALISVVADGLDIFSQLISEFAKSMVDQQGNVFLPEVGPIRVVP